MGRVHSFTLLTPSPAPPIHVTVSSGSGWLALVIAVAGLLTATVSLGWQVISWRLSGSRVRVGTSYATSVRALWAGTPDAFADNVQGKSLDALITLREDDVTRRSFDDLHGIMVAATIWNTGRIPVTIQRCIWESESGSSMESPLVPPGVRLPHRLEAYDQCASVILLQQLMSEGELGIRQIRPVINVANKRRPLRGKPLAIPTNSPFSSPSEAGHPRRSPGPHGNLPGVSPPNGD